MLDELDSEIEKQWEYYMDLNKRLESTTLQLVNSESKMSIFKASQVTLGNNFYESLSRKAEPLRSSSRSWEVGNVSYKCGIIRKEEESRFQRLVFRMSKGNAFTNFVPVESVYDSDQPEMKHKSVFFILFPSRDIMYL
jgi:V-type H+-transporting ATPase subunit a